MKMSIAQALRKRAELISNITTLQQRVLGATIYVEGRESYAPEDYTTMCNDLTLARGKLVALKIAIDKGNHIAQNGKSVYEAIVERGDTNALLVFAEQVRSTVHSTGSRQYNYRNNDEVAETKSRVTVKQADEHVDMVRQKLRDLDNEISDKNGSLQIEVNI